MQFSVVALTLISAVAVQADAISQIGDGQIQATTATPAPSSSAAPVSTASSNTTAVVPETANGANQVTGGVFAAGLVAAGALLI